MFLIILNDYASVFLSGLIDIVAYRSVASKII